jgi:hypothetical protein
MGGRRLRHRPLSLHGRCDLVGEADPTAPLQTVSRPTDNRYVGPCTSDPYAEYIISALLHAAAAGAVGQDVMRIVNVRVIHQARVQGIQHHPDRGQGSSLSGLGRGSWWRPQAPNSCAGAWRSIVGALTTGGAASRT